MSRNVFSCSSNCLEWSTFNADLVCFKILVFFVRTKGLIFDPGARARNLFVQIVAVSLSVTWLGKFSCVVLNVRARCFEPIFLYPGARARNLVDQIEAVSLSVTWFGILSFLVCKVRVRFFCLYSVCSVARVRNLVDQALRELRCMLLICI
ncbi:hypothetical protein C1646_720096 [Rhizophagus diaphanus]|nr:hypothetical protein C1646_720096 [Rhizophagus diaphanus] [Rhizophagus sp. MUCL 43196]